MCVCDYIIIGDSCDRDRFLGLLSLVTGSLVRGDREAVGSGLDRGTRLRDTSVDRSRKRSGVRQSTVTPHTPSLTHTLTLVWADCWWWLQVYRLPPSLPRQLTVISDFLPSLKCGRCGGWSGGGVKGWGVRGECGRYRSEGVSVGRELRAGGGVVNPPCSWRYFSTLASSSAFVPLLSSPNSASLRFSSGTYARDTTSPRWRDECTWLPPHASLAFIFFSSAVLISITSSSSAIVASEFETARVTSTGWQVQSPRRRKLDLVPSS